MPLMQEAMDKEDWERMDKGLPPLPKKKVVKPEPKFPKIENQIAFVDIPLDRFEKLISARRKVIKNDEGVQFVGMDLVIELKKGAGRPAKSDNPELSSRTITGWMIEADWYKLYRHIREKIDIRVVVY